MPDSLTPAQQTETFTAALLGGVPEGMHGLLWTRQDHRSTWFAADQPADVAADVQRLAADAMDVYIAVSVAAMPPPKAHRHSRRIESANSAGLMALWLDIDYTSPDAHKKWNLPPDEKAATELVEALGPEPSMVVHSGHGLQAWWLFERFWAFENETERVAAATLAQRWNNTLRVRAAERQFTVDSVFDLARVMRVPGTTNHKGATPVPVRLLRSSPVRYKPEDFTPHLVDDTILAARGLMPTRTYQPDELELTETLAPPFAKHAAAMANDPKYAETWERKRRDFLDQSPSVYDMSLASLAVGYGWSDQEIAALLVGFRQHHSLDVQKALRPDYVGRTIGRARESRQRDEAVEQVEDVADALEQARASGDDEDIKASRRAALQVVSAQLGIEVLHLWQFTSEPPSYQLVTPTHRVDLKDTDALLAWPKIRTAIYEVIGHQLDRFKQPAWDRLTALFPRVWEQQDVGFETTERGQVHMWLSYYLEDKPAVGSQEEALEMEVPFINADGRTVIFGPALRRYLHYKFGDRINPREMGRMLRKADCTADAVNVVNPETHKRTTKAVWILPRDWQT